MVVAVKKALVGISRFRGYMEAETLLFPRLPFLSFVPTPPPHLLSPLVPPSVFFKPISGRLHIADDRLLSGTQTQKHNNACSSDGCLELTPCLAAKFLYLYLHAWKAKHGSSFTLTFPYFSAQQYMNSSSMDRLTDLIVH